MTMIITARTDLSALFVKMYKDYIFNYPVNTIDEKTPSMFKKGSDEYDRMMTPLFNVATI